MKYSAGYILLQDILGFLGRRFKSDSEIDLLEKSFPNFGLPFEKCF